MAQARIMEEEKEEKAKHIPKTSYRTLDQEEEEQHREQERWAMRIRCRKIEKKD